jgi:hypothetical protein
MSETVILITVISSAILSPFLNYLYNSRCKKITCCCMNCEREIVDNDNETTQIPNSNVKNKNQL